MRYFQKCPYCKGRAFEYKRLPVSGELMSEDNVYGAKNGERIMCSSCNKIFYSNSAFFYEYLIVE
jgi:uncharacterized protein with PIN domain